MHKGYATTYSGSSAFKIYMDDIYEKKSCDASDLFYLGAPFFMLKALSYYFLSPFPWGIPRSHPLLIFFCPQVIFTFICLPFMAIGILRSLRHSQAITASVIMLLALIALPQAMAEGIIGNVVRHRDMFMPFILVFSAYGFYISMMQLEKNSNSPD